MFFILGGGETDPYKYFYALYAGVTIVWCISTALLFLDIFFAKRAEPERFERERRIPVGWLYVCGVVRVRRQRPGGAVHLRGLVVPDGLPDARRVELPGCSASRPSRSCPAS